jgi:hypothetical protein
MTQGAVTRSRLIQGNRELARCHAEPEADRSDQPVFHAPVASRASGRARPARPPVGRPDRSDPLPGCDSRHAVCSLLSSSTAPPGIRMNSHRCEQTVEVVAAWPTGSQVGRDAGVALCRLCQAIRGYQVHVDVQQFHRLCAAPPPLRGAPPQPAPATLPPERAPARTGPVRKAVPAGRPPGRRCRAASGPGRPTSGGCSANRRRAVGPSRAYST